MLIRLSEYMVPVRSLSKPHKGIVVDNLDPLKLGRVKCTIEGTFEAVKEDLPWVVNPNDPDALNVPEIGSEVKIVFPFNDIYSPEIDGYLHSSKNHNIDFDTDYPNTFGIVKQGFKLLYNKIKKIADIVHPSGTTGKILEDGTVELNLAKDLKLVVTGLYEINSTGDIKFTAGAKFEVVATGDINLTSDGVAKLIGKSSTTIGDASSTTKVDGASILLGGGGLGVALLTSESVGVGNMGAPVISKIISASSKVLAPL